MLLSGIGLMVIGLTAVVVMIVVFAVSMRKMKNKIVAERTPVSEVFKF